MIKIQTNKPKSNVGFVFFIFCVFVFVISVLTAWNMHQQNVVEKVKLYHRLNILENNVETANTEYEDIKNNVVPSVQDSIFTLNNEVQNINKTYKTNAYCVSTEDDKGYVHLQCKRDPIN